MLGPYRALSRPGVVVGDQVATDGVFAARLGFAFAHVQYTGYDPPLGPAGDARARDLGPAVAVHLILACYASPADGRVRT